MIGLFILFLILISVNVYILSNTIKKKENWIVPISLGIASILGTIFIIGYSLSNAYLCLTSDIFNYLLLCGFALVVFLILLIVLFVFRSKNLNHDFKKLDNCSIKNSVVLPFVLVILSCFAFCIVDYSCFILKNKNGMLYDEKVKDEEIDKMVEFLNNKYSINLNADDCIFYDKSNYSRSSDVLGNTVTHNVPYSAMFRNGDDVITAYDRDGFISDNGQLKDLNQLLINYFQDKTGLVFDFIEFNKSYVGSPFSNDIVIGEVLQNKFNDLITDDNIEQFVECLLSEPDLAINFYVRNSGDITSLKDSVVSQLDYLRNYSNIEVLKVYGYNDLIVNHRGVVYFSEFTDNTDISEFGCYYVDANLSSFAFYLSMDLDRGYTALGEPFNGWKFLELN